MDSSTIPGNGKWGVRDKSAFHGRIDSDNEEEFLKKPLKVQMAVFTVHQTLTNAFGDALLTFRCFFSFTFRLFWLRLILVGGKGFITFVTVRLGCCPEPIHKVVIRPQRWG